MKALLLVLMIGIAGCSVAHKGTHRTESGNRIEWSNAPIGDFKEGSQRQIADGDCGYVIPNNLDAGLQGTWLAAAYPTPTDGVRRYHTKQDAIAYVEKWCKP